MKLNLGERWLVNSPLRLALQKRVLKRLRWMAEPGRGEEILEIGCGRGQGGRLLEELFAPRRLVLLDLDQAMARRAARRGGLALVADAERLPLRGASFGAVYGFGFLHHVPDWRRALEEVARVLRPGGVYFLEEYYPAAYLNPLARLVLRHPVRDRFHSRDLHLELDRAGFSLLGCQEHPWWGIVAAARKDSRIFHEDRQNSEE